MRTGAIVGTGVGGEAASLKMQWMPRYQNAADMPTDSNIRSVFTRLLKLIGVRFPDKTTMDSLSEGGFWNVGTLTALHKCLVVTRLAPMCNSGFL